MTIRYEQNRDESIALLKLVIAQMNQHDAPCNPTSYAVWYEYLSGMNPRLTQAVDEARQREGRLGDAAIQALYRDFVAPPDERATEGLRDEFQRLMEGMARSAASTGQKASAYGEQLAGLSQALQGPPSPSLAPRIDALADGTAQMREAVDTLKRAVDEGEREIDRLRAALERTRVEAVTDALSRLLNRKGFDAALHDVLAQRPGPGFVHALLLFDIDHFKKVNDTHGHLVGDAIIEGVGQVLGGVASGRDWIAARYGGEEFAVLMRSGTLAQALQVAETVLDRVRNLKVKKRGTQTVIASTTVSCGVAPWVPGEKSTSWIAAADAALYRAKQGGRDRVTVA